jgi:hypothetical protein
MTGIRSTNSWPTLNPVPPSTCPAVFVPTMGASLFSRAKPVIEGIYPVHLISQREIPIHLIRQQGVIPCEIRVSDDEQTWAFEPSGIPHDSPDFFRLEFTIPEFIADMLNARTEERHVGEAAPRWLRIAQAKAENMSFVDVTTVEEGQLLPFRLALDFDWLNRYIEGRHAREAVRQERRVARG